MPPTTSLPEDAKNTILEFIKELRDGVFTEPSDQGDLLLVEFFFQKLHPLSVMTHLVEHVLPYEKEIKAKDRTFFITKKDQIFAGLPKERINYFADMITKPEDKGGISKDTENAVWEYFKTLRALSMKYKKLK